MTHEPRRHAPSDARADWRAAYNQETLFRRDSADFRAACRREIELLHDERRDFVLVDAGDVPLAFSAFNAALPDMVQVGGVWTPVQGRSRGFARCVVAGSLREARASGVTRAILFTDEHNRPAQRAYVAPGFRPIGDYGLLGFADGQRASPRT